jgi:glycerol kinase
VTASVVDQQAALFGHGCSKPGDTKITFGTGAFALAITGPTRITDNKLGISPTLAWRIGDNPPVFAIEGGVYNAASSVNWARELGLFSSFAEIDSFDRPPAITRDIAFVPALSGLACPHWDRNAAGLWIGMGLDTTRSDMMQSLLEGVALRVAEVIAAMGKVIQLPRSVSVDGGMAKNAYLLRFLADALATTVVVPSITDVTAMGTARLAMMGLGAETLPPLPEPKKTILARTPLSREAKNRFSEAVLRSKGWKM